jgi:hypothetical protein
MQSRQKIQQKGDHQCTSTARQGNVCFLYYLFLLPGARHRSRRGSLVGPSFFIQFININIILFKSRLHSRSPFQESRKEIQNFQRVE